MSADWPVNATCPVCRTELVGDDSETPEGIVANHTRRKHVPRPLDPAGWRFPADAALTVGKGKTLFRVSGASFIRGRIQLRSIIKGAVTTVEKSNVRWDGKTYFATRSFNSWTYVELPENWVKQEATPLETGTAELARSGFFPTVEHEYLTRGMRVHHVGEQYTGAAAGTATVMEVFRRIRGYAIEYECLVLHDRDRDTGRLTQWGDYHAVPAR